MSSFFHWFSWEHITRVIAFLSFFISTGNAVITARGGTINDQAPLLSELRGYLDYVYKSCQQISVNLDLDSHMIHTNRKPNLPRMPEGGFTEAIEKMPELGKTITSVGQRQVDLLQVIVAGADEHWRRLESCLDADPINTMALESAARLKRQCRIINKFFPEYIAALIAINKTGRLWKRFRYKDHHQLTYRLFRWTPLQQAVSGYEQALIRGVD